MSAILKFEFQKREQLRFSEVNYLNYTKKKPDFTCDNYIFPKTRGNRKCHGPIPHPLMIDQVSMDATKVWMPPAHVIMGLER